MTKDEMNQAATAFVNVLVASHCGSRVKVHLDWDSQAVVSWSVSNGSTRGLPVTGSHDLSRLGNELDVESGNLNVTFRLVGEINGKPINSRIWIDRTIDVGNRPEMTDKAAQIVWDIAADVRAALVEADTLGLHKVAQSLKLANVAKRAQERIDYLQAVVERANAGVLARA